MVRGLGVSHKSLLVPNVTEGSYAIEFKHADYLTKGFNISVGAALPTTFTEAMEESLKHISLVLPNANGKLFLSNTIIACDDPAKACTEFKFQLTSDGNTNVGNPWYKVSIVGGATFYTGETSTLGPGETSAVISETVCALPGGLPIGTHTVKVEVGVGSDAITPTDLILEDIFVIEWTTDITFVATAPGIPDLHGVEVFIDNVSMGTT